MDAPPALARSPGGHDAGAREPHRTRGLASPSVATLERLFAAMGERVVIRAEPLPGSNRTIGDLRADLQLSPGERVAQAAQLSFALTSIATRA